MISRHLSLFRVVAAPSVECFAMEPYPDSVFNGRRIKNGWQNSGLPWTYEINLEIIWIPEHRRTAVEQPK